jgi:hypothetical protein
MSAVSFLMSPAPIRAVGTSVATSALAYPGLMDVDERFPLVWEDRVINTDVQIPCSNQDRRKMLAQLSDWARDPSLLEDEGVIAPKMEIIELARAALENIPRVPSTVVPSGDGGIVFNFAYSSGVFIMLELSPDGMGVYGFKDGILVDSVMEPYALQH